MNYGTLLGATPRARRRQIDILTSEKEADHATSSITNADAIDGGVLSAGRFSRGSSVETGGEGSSSDYLTASEKRGRKSRSASRSINGLESTDDEGASVYEEVEIDFCRSVILSSRVQGILSLKKLSRSFYFSRLCQ